ncbi:MAG: ferritin family protein [Burkholderiales bacterium]|jgi:rubrerythrin
MDLALPEFLAHAVALEDEAAERYLELADMMEAHRNDAVSSVFRSMNRFSQMHCDSIKLRVGSIELPKLKSWEYRWSSPPEVGGEEGFDYMIEPYNALKYARANEVRAMQFYRSVAEGSTDEGVRRLAGEFAHEEAEHVAALDKWIELTPRPSTTWEDDPGTIPPVV